MGPNVPQYSGKNLSPHSTAQHYKAKVSFFSVVFIAHAADRLNRLRSSPTNATAGCTDHYPESTARACADGVKSTGSYRRTNPT